MMQAVNNAVQIHQAQFATQVDMAVAKKTLDAAKLQGEAVKLLLESAVAFSKDPNLGQNFDAFA